MVLNEPFIKVSKWVMLKKWVEWSFSKMKEKTSKKA
jgi:hypothetical protein